MRPCNFHVLYTAGRVARYHTVDVPAQSLAEHSWGVAMILSVIASPAYPNLANLLKAALTHDLAESVTGDAPATAKWDNSDLTAALAKTESIFDRRYGIDFDLSPKEKHFLQWADMFELCLYCDHQTKLGNQYAAVIRNRGLKHIREVLRFPSQEAEDLFYEHFPEE